MNRLNLEKGEVDIEGDIRSLEYSDVPGPGGKNESFLSRLFR